MLACNLLMAPRHACSCPQSQRQDCGAAGKVYADHAITCLRDSCVQMAMCLFLECQASIAEPEAPRITTQAINWGLSRSTHLGNQQADTQQHSLAAHAQLQTDIHPVMRMRSGPHKAAPVLKGCRGLAIEQQQLHSDACQNVTHTLTG